MMSDNRGHQAQSDGAPHATWPQDVRSISMDGMDHLGVGNDGALYWDGKLIEIRKSFDLNWWQILLAGITAVSALTVAVVEVVTLYITTTTP